MGLRILPFSTKSGRKNEHQCGHSLKDDLKIWLAFTNNFNGYSLWQEDVIPKQALHLFADAAGSIGYFNGHWSAEKHPDSLIQNGFNKNIVLVELFTVLVAINIWGEQFKNKGLLHLDNKGVVFAINCLSSKSPRVVTILRHLVLCCLQFNIWLKASYVEGEYNIIADSVSPADGQFPKSRPSGNAMSSTSLGSFDRLILANIQNSLAPKTWEDYSTSCNIFSANFNNSYLQTDIALFLSYVACLMSQNLSVSSIYKSLARISFMILPLSPITF